MKRLRAIHLYLSCVFAPLLLFFAISGIWQTWGSVGIFAEVVEHSHAGAMEGWRRAGEFAAAHGGADHGGEFYHDSAGRGDGV